jgi:UDP-N-acetylglucosamine--N-acetylmuramyl-(pentapeptide) pyrophosphoryl-undecaprenol N-acetylglucosamine transferase
MTTAKSVERVLVTAGGTGGHVFPALAAAKLFEQQGVKVRWIGTRQGIESSVVPANHIDIDYLDVAGVRGQGLARLIWAPLKIIKAVFRALGIMHRFKPDLVLGMGGFVTGPTGIAGWLSGRPVFIHEQNAIAGFTNRMLALLAKKVFQAFPDAFPANKKVEIIGNPVRAEIAELSDPVQRYRKRSGPIRFLVLGGSQGAVALNELVPKALAQIHMAFEFKVRHQAGAKNQDKAEACYQQAGVDAEVIPFIDDMASAYEWADVVICRSGALTVSELAAAGVASVLIPYPFAVDDHQTRNGEYLSCRGAAYLLQQNELNEVDLANLIKTQLCNREILLEMAVKARSLAMLNATEKLVLRCVEVASGD